MAQLFVSVLAALAVTFVSAQTGSSCAFSQQAIEQNVMECVAHEPALLLQFIGHMRNPQSMATMGFVCENQKAVVDVFVCLEEKYTACYPAVKDVAMQYMPNRDRLTDAVNFMCAHKADLLENNCMDQSQLQEFMQCYMTSVMSTVQTARVSHDMQTAICSIIHSEEQCFKTYHGKCPSNYVSLVIELLNKLVPGCPVLTVDIKDQAMNNALGSILVQGQPLHFQPKGDVKYNVVEG